ncbi:hypothetical protein EYR36_000430 [Pleurotus pulmonarius]|nr:hypothetical protein EYR36_000430 [Pleurotus pulmonarius]
MHRLPIELRFLVFEEMGRDSLRNYSLVSKSWRNLCLPALFRELKTVNILSIAELHACSDLLTNSPNLRPHVRKVTFRCTMYPVYVDDKKHGMVATILSDLPGLDELNCPSILSDTLSFVLPQLPITKLYLALDTYSPPDPLPVLEAVASTLRSLTLQNLGFGDEESTVSPFDPRTRNAPICMTALEDLAVVSCVIPLTSKLFRLPVLKTLYCEGEGVTLGDGVPSSLKTLVVVDANTVGKSYS